jgi:hypothetical protein
MRWTIDSRVWIPRLGDFSFVQSEQIGSYLRPTGVLFQVLNGRDVRLNTQLRSMSRLRMRGVIPLLPLYAYMV